MSAQRFTSVWVPSGEDIGATLHLTKGPPHPMATPALKWVGGKQRVLAQLVPLLPPPEAVDHYADAFVGGGAMLLHMVSRWHPDKQKTFRIYANDTNAHLVLFCQSLGRWYAEIAAAACRLASAHNATSYKQARTLFNAMRPLVQDSARRPPQLEVLHAALFLYLNKCGFNGLYRENERGDFNVGPNKNATWRPKLEELVVTLRDVAWVYTVCGFSTLDAGQFIEDQLSMSEKIIHPERVFYFLDPPYVNEAEDGFVGYGGRKWTRVDLMMLSLSVGQIHESGARFMLTHLDTPLVRELFSHGDYNITPITTRHSVNSDGAGRTPVAELAIRNYR